FRGDYRMTNRDTLSFQAGYNGGTRETQAPPAVQPDPIDYPRTIRVNNRFEQLQWVRALDDNGELSLQLYHNYLGVRDVSLSQPLPIPGSPQLVIDDSIRAHRYDAELQHTLNLRPGLRWVWGGSWRYDVTNAPLSFSAPVGNHSQRFFGHAEWQATRRWLVNAGAMVERTHFTPTEVSPRVALSYRVAPGHTLRVGYSRAVRNPTLVEEKVDRKYVLGPVTVQRFLASGNLSPERIVSRDAGYVGEFPHAGLMVDLRVFSDRITDLIREVLVPYPASLDGVTRDFRNLADLHQYGFETQLRWRPTRSTQLGIAQARVLNSSNDAAVARSTPKSTYSAFVVHTLPSGLSGTLMAFHQDAVQALGYSEPQRPINRIDARLAQQYRIGRTKAEVALVAQNLLNYSYTDFRHENVFDRRVYATLRLEY
ncbi:MAG TPA: TonB-dependent receptor, partial [Burkholderiales bacterium]|nr:TonB-dependent receptor [Burkholderiales bacterium]